MQKELRAKKNGKPYIVSPWALTWDDENYYLIAYNEASDSIRHYRVDKMQHMHMLEKNRIGKERFQTFDIAEFAKKTFGMYGGSDERVTLLCHNEIIGVILDRFGKDVMLIPEGKNHFKVKVLISVSQQFFGWVTGIGTRMQIAGPETVKEKYKAYLQEILDRCF